MLLAALLVAAPLYRGGNRPMALLALELVAVAALAWLAWRRAGGLRLAVPGTLALGLVLLVGFPLLQLVPLPGSWWAALPGREAYARVLEVAGPGALGWRPASLHPRATEYAWLALLPPLAAFLLTLALPRDGVRRAAMLFVGLALVQAVLGLAQLGAAGGSPLYLGNAQAQGFAVGTYVNRNHFASLMAMALPMAVALWAVGAFPGARGGSGALHPRHGDRRVALGIVLATLLLLIVAALLFSRSRAGIGAGLLGLALASFALVWRGGSAAARLALAATGVAAGAFAAYIGLTPVLDRFTPDALALGYEGRLAIVAASLRAALDFLPIGSGLGTFADVFRRYQAEGLGGFVEHAHNDYVEAFVELGVVGLAVGVLFAAGYAMRWGELLGRAASGRLAGLQLAAGCSLAAMFVHAAFDFNFHIPANAVFFAFLAGVFFRAPATPDAGRA